MLEVITYKKTAYTELYNDLVSIQRSYNRMSRYLNRQAGAFIPKNSEEVMHLDAIERQIAAADRNVERFEEIKFWYNIAILSEGSLLSSTELSTLITMIEEAIDIAKKEEVLDKSLTEWALDKITILQRINDVLTQLMEHKVERQLNNGDIDLQ